VLLAAGEVKVAEQLLQTFTFDEGTSKAAIRLMNAAPPAQRPALLRAGVVALDFDDARLALLRARPAEAAALSPADRKVVLGTFAFERETAEALLR
jgi:hypothetical protein